MDFQTEFNAILQLRSDVELKQKHLHEKMDEFREQYNEIVKQHDKKIYLYSLDSLFFQYKILRGEMEQFQRTIALVCNRMYGDYYKFYVIIQSQCAENGIESPKTEEVLTVYKELEPEAEYSLDDLRKVHSVILSALNHLERLYESKHNTIEQMNHTMTVGFSITNFITTLNYENKLLRDHIRLFSEYLTFYHESQRRNINTLLRKITAFIQDVDTDILTNHKVFIKPLKTTNSTPIVKTDSLAENMTIDIVVSTDVPEDAESESETVPEALFHTVKTKRNRKKKK